MIDATWHNPWRSPAWPWLRANGIVEGTAPGVAVRRDGAIGARRVRPLVQYLQAYRQCDSDEQKMQLAYQRPDLFWAHNIYLSDRPIKWIIEARLLAREEDSEIASRLGCQPSIVKCYHDVFFDVREKINNRDWVINSVFGEAVFRGLSERQYDLLWKLFAFYGGPHVLDDVSSRLPGASWCNSPSGATNFLRDTALNVMKYKAAVAALTVQINQETNLDLLNAFVKYVEIERTTDSQGQARDAVIENIQKTLEALPFAVVHDTEAMQGELANFDRSSTDLRTEEMLTLAIGAKLPYAELLLEMSFPPPPLQVTAQEVVQ